MTQIYISIGNSDDKLTQRQWCEFVAEVEEALHQAQAIVHGMWFSRPDAAWQNACWCIDEPASRGLLRLRDDLRELAHRYQQDSIAFAVAHTEFLA